jgi:hypothetical protein
MNCQMAGLSNLCIFFEQQMQGVVVNLSKPVYLAWGCNRMACPSGIEPLTYALEGHCSIQLS